MLNKKYIIVICLFILEVVSFLFTKSTYLNILAAPVALLICFFLFKNELGKTDYNKLFNSKVIYQNSYNAFIICLLLQAFSNVLASKFSSHSIAAPQLPHTTLTIPLISISTVIFGPILEELIFRRIIFGIIQQDREKFSILAATISSVLFSASHLNELYSIGYFAVGMVLCYYYHSSRSLFVTILTHMYLNLSVIFFQSLYIVWSGN